MTTVLPSAMKGTARLSLEHNLGASIPASQKILVAVASEELADMLKRGLEVENYLVDRAQDGREALERATAQSSPYQLLILDALLEHKSGFDICRDLRKNKRETPVILLGGRLPAGIVDRIANGLNQRVTAYGTSIPATAPVARAALSDDAPAVGAAILPFSHRLLPTRTALMKVAAL